MVTSNNKKIIVIVLVLILVLSTLTFYANFHKIEAFFSKQEELPPQVEPLEEEDNQITKNVKNMLQQLDKEMITGYIKDLEDIGPHITARQILSRLPRLKKLPIEEAREYISNELEDIGYQVRYQEWAQKRTIETFFKKPSYSWGWFEGENIEATLPGSDPNSDEIFVLLAHYDTWPRSPGSNDDSSGVAAILAAAKLMRQYEFNHTVRFVFVDGEEQGLLGSNAYAEEAVKNNDNIVAGFVLDMIGTHGPQYRGQELLLGVNDQSKCFGDFFVEVNNRYSEFFDYTVFQDNANDYGSDHKSFIAHGLRAIYVAEAVDDPDHHKPTDTLERLDIETVVDNSKLVLATVAELAWDVEYE